MSWSKRLILASVARWSVDIGSALVEFHPASERRLHAHGRVDTLEICVLDVLLDLGPDFDEGLLLGGTRTRRIGPGADAGDDLAWPFENCLAVEGVEIPARGARLLGKLTLLLVRSEEHTSELQSRLHLL